MKNFDSIKDITDATINFRNERDWKQFHNPKDLAVSLVLEASEVLEHFQWKTPAEVEEHIHHKKNELGNELADVLSYLVLLAHESGIDLAEAYKTKMNENARKYSVEKAKGNHTKYTDL